MISAKFKQGPEKSWLVMQDRLYQSLLYCEATVYWFVILLFNLTACVRSKTAQTLSKCHCWTAKHLLNPPVSVAQNPMRAFCHTWLAKTLANPQVQQWKWKSLAHLQQMSAKFPPLLCWDFLKCAFPFVAGFWVNCSQRFQNSAASAVMNMLLQLRMAVNSALFNYPAQIRQHMLLQGRARTRVWHLGSRVLRLRNWVNIRFACSGIESWDRNFRLSILDCQFFWLCHAFCQDLHRS